VQGESGVDRSAYSRKVVSAGCPNRLAGVFPQVSDSFFYTHNHLIYKSFNITAACICENNFVGLNFFRIFVKQK
jgi:hypothetical protein